MGLFELVKGIFGKSKPKGICCSYCGESLENYGVGIYSEALKGIYCPRPKDCADKDLAEECKKTGKEIFPIYNLHTLNTIRKLYSRGKIKKKNL